MQLEWMIHVARRFGIFWAVAIGLALGAGIVYTAVQPTPAATYTSEAILLSVIGSSSDSFYQRLLTSADLPGSVSVGPGFVVVQVVSSAPGTAQDGANKSANELVRRLSIVREFELKALTQQSVAYPDVPVPAIQTPLVMVSQQAKMGDRQQAVISWSHNLRRAGMIGGLIAMIITVGVIAWPYMGVPDQQPPGPAQRSDPGEIVHSG